ncbi:long-chain-fatty-acid--CoA ligase [Kallotenue papyrolyticum]|uniref:long-chain-fatty-acid--CoA ligase n=1 Tax=Kallotenue papyrolyticum TaxID=1325125 RepID=UPI00047227BA|nr:long-chain-fatty-acid--CoA ligase [Kallotenue papyrolyticum]
MYGIGFWLQRHAELHPRRIALTTPERNYSYGDLNRAANQAAHGLRALGLREGDRIGILALNDPRFLTLLFAAGKLGVVVVALNYRLSVPELAYQIADSGVGVLFVGEEQAEMIDALREQTGVERVFVLSDAARAHARAYHELIAGQPDDEPDAPLPWDRPLLMVYTSGTTGKPKGAVLTHANQFWNAINDIVPLRLTADDVAITLLPLVHVGGIGLFTLPILLLGGRVVLPRRFEPEEALRLIERERVTVVMGVPAIFQMLLASPRFDATDLSSVRFFYNGGDRCPLEVVEAFKRRGLAFGGGYGLTETSPTAFMMEPEDFARGTTRLGFIGKPALFTEAQLRTPDGHRAAPGEVGEIWVRGPNVFGGYWQQPEATAQAFAEGWFRTGDLAVQDEDGLTYVVGRSKEMFKSGGLNVYPAEVEAVLSQHPAVREVCVIGVPDPQWNEVGRAIVALQPGAQATAEELLAWCDGKLARYKIPRSVVFVEALPRNTLGKINRGDLQQQYGAPNAGGSYAA